MLPKEQTEQKAINYGTKVIDRINENVKNKQRFFSMEFYPPRTEKGVESLKKSLANMVKWGPQWMDVTWGAGGTTSDLTPEICNYIQNSVQGNCMMHLTCTNMPAEKVDIALKQAKDMGFKNILALRGDPPEGQKEWKAIEGGFKCALDLVKYIRKQYGDYFGITVSGYPEGHPTVRKKIEDAAWKPEVNANPKYYAVQQLEDGSYVGVSEKDWIGELDYLKQKIEAGGQVIITQLFYDAQMFIEWVKDVRKHGIKAPILPGIMPIRNFGSFTRMTGFCKTIIPTALQEQLNALKDDEGKLYAFGMDYIQKMCETLLNTKLENGEPLIPGLHLYTMNTEQCTVEILVKCKKTLKLNAQQQALVDSELQRVLDEEEQKRLRKLKAKEAKIAVLTAPSPVDQGQFKEVTSF
mmetsp:Transcript_38721/g.61789  ORF Transcript_38721/g.61789 Transcript_38721/m.61789 type:complete len:409 (-) Transcript_38721:371-1597(-)